MTDADFSFKSFLGHLVSIRKQNFGGQPSCFSNQGYQLEKKIKTSSTSIKLSGLLYLSAFQNMEETFFSSIDLPYSRASLVHLDSSFESFR